MKTFQGKVAVITGAGSGLGRSLAIALNQSGAHLALCDLNQVGLEETISFLNDKSLHATHHRVDVSDPGKMQQFSEDAVTQHGQVDLLISLMSYKAYSMRKLLNQVLT